MDHLRGSFERIGLKHLAAISIWLLAGLGCLCVDDQLQPYLTNAGRHPTVRAVAEDWQELGATAGILLFLAAGALYGVRDRGRTFVLFALSVSLAGAAAQVIKHLAGRARPNLVHDTTHFYGPLGMFNEGPAVVTDSMPSGHTAAAFAMAVALGWRWPRAAGLWYVLACGVGIARTLVDRHFPSDVVLGAWLGTIVGAILCEHHRRAESLAQPPQIAIKSL